MKENGEPDMKRVAKAMPNTAAAANDRFKPSVSKVAFTTAS